MSGRTRTRRTTVAVLVALTALVVGALVAPAVAHADDTCTITWKSGAGAWSDPTRWSPARVPTSDDDVCVIRATGAGPVSVKVAASADVWHLTLRGAALSVEPTAFFDVSSIDASRATLTGGGEIRGSAGIIDLTDTQLRGVHLSTGGGLRLTGQIGFTGGSTVEASGFTDPKPGVRIVDGDGNGANHISLSRFPLYLFGPVFVGVGLELRDVSVFSQGDLVLARLDNLEADGTLTAFNRTSIQLEAGANGSITLPRSITTIASRVSVFGGVLRTPDGSDALQTLTTVDGSLGLDRAVSTRPLTVRGRLTTSEPLGASTVSVRSGAYFAADEVYGTLVCGGQCILAGAHLARLILQPGADVTMEATEPITVGTTARIDGTLRVSTPAGRPRPGTQVVLLTAAGGVTGTFDTVTADRPNRTVTPSYHPTYVTGTVDQAA